MNLFKSLPDELIEMVWRFEGRYTELKKDMNRCFDIIDFRRKAKPFLKSETYELLKNQKSFWQQQDIWYRDLHNSPYSCEYRWRAHKYDKRCNIVNGSLKGVTGEHKTNYEFADVIGRYSIRKTLQLEFKTTVVVNGVDVETNVKSKDRFWQVVTYSHFGCLCHYHYKDYIWIYRWGGQGLQYKNEKNGIELLDPKFVKKAQKTKKGKALIQHLLKV